jgi:N-acetylglucosamine-6-phosphate deacetylase
LAPELPGALDVVRRLVDAGVAVSAGHSSATAAQATAAVDAGVRWVTHLFNAMAPLHHREPGLAGVALTDDRLRVGLIADGVHVHPLVVALAAQALGDRLTLVTDAIAALGQPPGPVLLGPVAAVSDGTSVRLADGTLAGSVLPLDQAVRNLSAFGLPAPGPSAPASSAPGSSAGAGLSAFGPSADASSVGPDPAAPGSSAEASSVDAASVGSGLPVPGSSAGVDLAAFGSSASGSSASGSSADAASVGSDPAAFGSSALGSSAGAGVDLAAGVRAASTVPAAVLGLPDRGVIAPGAVADLVLLDSDGTVAVTIVGGEVAYDRSGTRYGRVAGRR